MSYIKIRCNPCHKAHQIEATEIDFEQVDSDERRMGAEIMYEGNKEIQCDCGNDIEVTHHFWEYPHGIENDKETKVSGGTVVENTL